MAKKDVIRGWEEAQNRIRQASQTSAASLDLKNLWLSTLPPEVLGLKNLQDLDVYCNRIEAIPDEISCLENLRVLDFGMNHIKSLPAGLYKLSHLRKLSVNKVGYDRGISELPDEIGNFQELTHLDLSGHLLSRLPHRFKTLKNLQCLRLSDNRFSHFPEEILPLEKLTQLYLKNNAIAEIPYEIGQLAKLEELDLSNADPRFISPISNAIVSLPESLAKLKHLKYLNLANNPLPLERDLLSKAYEPKRILDTYFKEIVFRIQPKSHAKIFINYSRIDQEAAEKIYKLLDEAGHSPWMDVHSIQGGEIWLNAIDKAISECELFIAVLSQNSVNRRGVLQKELKTALDKWDEMLPDDIYLIPIRLDECPIPDRLKNFQVLDWEDGKHKDKLLQAIQVGLQRRKE